MNTLHRYDPDDPYPESDGLPMAENTEQYDWLVKIKENLEILFADRADVFIAGDLFWYPVPDRKLASPLAPDVMVVFGRPKGKRGSYKQWEENEIAPQVVFEILSPSNTPLEMKSKKSFYDQYDVQEYYVYDPERNRLEIWTRQNKHLQKVTYIGSWISPLLGIRFKLERKTLSLFYPTGQSFLNSVELHQHAVAMERRAEQEQQRAEREQKRAEREQKRAEREQQRAETAEQNMKQEHQEKEFERRAKEAALAEIARLKALLAENLPK